MAKSARDETEKTSPQGSLADDHAHFLLQEFYKEIDSVGQSFRSVEDTGRIPNSSCTPIPVLVSSDPLSVKESAALGNHVESHVPRSVCTTSAINTQRLTVLKLLYYKSVSGATDVFDTTTKSKLIPAASSVAIASATLTPSGTASVFSPAPLPLPSQFITPRPLSVSHRHRKRTPRRKGQPLKPALERPPVDCEPFQPNPFLSNVSSTPISPPSPVNLLSSLLSDYEDDADPAAEAHDLPENDVKTNEYDERPICASSQTPPTTASSSAVKPSNANPPAGLLESNTEAGASPSVKPNVLAQPLGRHGQRRMTLLHLHQLLKDLQFIQKACERLDAENEALQKMCIDKDSLLKRVRAKREARKKLQMIDDTT